MLYFKSQTIPFEKYKFLMPYALAGDSNPRSSVPNSEASLHHAWPLLVALGLSPKTFTNIYETDLSF
jgi:hypothetical protein